MPYASNEYELMVRKNNHTPYKWWTNEEEHTLRIILKKHRKSTIIGDAKKAFPSRSISSITNKIRKLDGRKY